MLKISIVPLNFPKIGVSCPNLAILDENFLTLLKFSDSRKFRVPPATTRLILPSVSLLLLLRTTAKAFASNVFINQERKSEVRRRSDTQHGAERMITASQLKGSKFRQ